MKTIKIALMIFLLLLNLLAEITILIWQLLNKKSFFPGNGCFYSGNER